MEFLTTETASALEWMRLPGDALFILGILPLLYVSWTSIRHMGAPVAAAEPTAALFTEVGEGVEARS
jgi:nitric oxide reductase subunit B